MPLLCNTEKAGTAAKESIRGVYSETQRSEQAIMMGGGTVAYRDHDSPTAIQNGPAHLAQSEDKGRAVEYRHA